MSTSPQGTATFSDVTAFVTHVNRTVVANPITALRVSTSSVTGTGGPLITVDCPASTAATEDIKRRLTVHTTHGKEQKQKQQQQQPPSHASLLLADLTLAPIIRAFRSTVEANANDQVNRKWNLFCSFDGVRKNGSGGGSGGGAASRRSIPMFRVELPSEVTAETPMMTPAVSADYPPSSAAPTPLAGAKKEGAALVTTATASAAGSTIVAAAAAAVAEGADGDAAGTLSMLGAPATNSAVYVPDDAASQSLIDLLKPLVTADTLASFVWSVRFSFVLGECDEEERTRRAEMQSAVSFTGLTRHTTEEEELEELIRKEVEERLQHFPDGMREQMRPMLAQSLRQQRGIGGGNADEAIPLSSHMGGLFGGLGAPNQLFGRGGGGGGRGGFGGGGGGFGGGGGGGLFGAAAASPSLPGQFVFGGGSGSTGTFGGGGSLFGNAVPTPFGGSGGFGTAVAHQLPTARASTGGFLPTTGGFGMAAIPSANSNFSGGFSQFLQSQQAPMSGRGGMGLPSNSNSLFSPSQNNTRTRPTGAR